MSKIRPNYGENLREIPNTKQKQNSSNKRRVENNQNGTIIGEAKK